MALPSFGAYGDYTRGIGQYPGRPSEFAGPQLVTGSGYRNLALNRMAYASSSADFNLTAQLATDGIISTATPPQLTVFTGAGPLGLRDKEKTIDGNVHSGTYLMGANSFIQYEWQGMDISLSELRLLGEVAYDEAQARGGYTIRVLARDSHRRWKVIGEQRGKGLPGFATRQTVSSDPNKQEATVRLPMRLIKTSIPLRDVGRISHLRVEFIMKGCAHWRIYEIDNGRVGDAGKPFSMNDVQWGISNTAWLPAASFRSAFATSVKNAAKKPEWLCVDLGAAAEFDKVKLHWVLKPGGGRLQTSDDGRSWRDLAPLPATSGNTETINCQGRGRYVRLLMTASNAPGTAMLSEIEVWGRGGLVARPLPPAPAPAAGWSRMSLGSQAVNWQLRREDDARWIAATVPGTVLTSYMNAGAVPDNRYANNMRQISESFFNADFRYRTTFRCHPKDRTYLNFDGINWKAEVWLNGTKLQNISGAFVRARYDVTGIIREGANTLEVKVIRNAHPGAVKEKNMESTDLNGGALGADNPTFHASIGWDWITSTPGREAGIWNDVYLTADTGITLSDALLTTTLNHPDTLASLTPAVRVKNWLPVSRTVTVNGYVGDIRFAKTVTLQPQEEREVSFSPAEFSQLKNRRMRLWWPNGYGEAYLYDAGFSITEDTVEAGSAPCSELTYKAGIREVSYKDLDSQAKIYVNGKRITPLGGNWGFAETNLNYRSREYDAAVRYHREMNYNMIRNWVGQTGDEAFYAACDRYGILVWQDFWLANPWDGPNPDDEAMFLANSRDYILRIRNHASIGIYVGRNEGFPPPAIDKALRSQVAGLHPQLGYIPSSADEGVSGHGPYRMMPVEYYFANQSHKLHSERGMPNVPNVESLRRMLEPDSIWPQNIAWAQHDYTMKGAQGGESFNAIIERRFGKPQDAAHFTALAQWLNYDGYRAMYESAQQERLGLLIWMSHSCWPSMVWCTYDYYLEPTAAYFGVKKACEPLHIQYNPVKRHVEVVDMGAGNHRGLKAVAETLDMRGRLLQQTSATVDIGEDQTVEAQAVTLPDESVYYIRLRLYDGSSLLSENMYVESREPDNWQALNTLPKVQLQQQEEFGKKGDEWTGTVRISNPSATPALMIRLNLLGNDGEQILPVVYSDNYFHLMPGESRTVTVSWHHEDSRGTQPHVALSGFNVTE